MRLTELLTSVPEPAVRPGMPTGNWPPLDLSADPEIRGIVYDSRKAYPGALFVAVWHRGYAADGHQYVAQAIQNGAAAVVVQRPVAVPPGVPLIQVERTSAALGWLAAAFHGMPSSKLGIVGVTGTDGKTTTSVLTTALLEAGGHPTGMATTVASKTVGPARPNPEHTSTPQPVEIQQLLAETVAGGGTRAVLEATSHALDQDRLAGCELDVAIVTRVTHEHMEYHGSRDAYLAAKARLLDLMHPNPLVPKRVPLAKAAVLNADDSSFAYMEARVPASVQVISYAIDCDAKVRASEVQAGPSGSRFQLTSPWGESSVNLAMPGTFNVYNAMAALAAACVLGTPFDRAVEALGMPSPVAGRMEWVRCGQPFDVLVDFAHTPDALTRVLQFLRPLTSGRLLVVFGSAGERDRDKRPWMGRIAAELADYAVFTDEDPRLEDRTRILEEIAAGARTAGATDGAQFVAIPERAEAIRHAFYLARPGDTVVLAGKGHEQSIIGMRDGHLHVFPWDEHAAARAALAEQGYQE